MQRSAGRSRNLIAGVFLAGLTLCLTAALTCHKSTEGYLFDELNNATTSNATNKTECPSEVGMGNSTRPTCFEFAIRNTTGPVAYGAGCGMGCPRKPHVQCRLCYTEKCNSGLAAEIRKQNLACYTGRFVRAAMTYKRRRKVWCADYEKKCFTITWLTTKIRTPKYFGGCGTQPCTTQPDTVCKIANCTKTLCNEPPKKPPKGCPATGCGAESNLRQSTGLQLALCLAVSVLFISHAH